MSDLRHDEVDRGLIVVLRLGHDQAFAVGDDVRRDDDLFLRRARRPHPLGVTPVDARHAVAVARDAADADRQAAAGEGGHDDRPGVEDVVQLFLVDQADPRHDVGDAGGDVSHALVRHIGLAELAHAEIQHDHHRRDEGELDGGDAVTVGQEGSSRAPHQ